MPDHQPAFTRRRALLGLAAFSLGACRSKQTPPSPVDGLRWKDLPFPSEEQRALVLAAPSTRPLPVLVALHGRGESGRGLEVGAFAWRDDYGLDRTDRRLHAPPLTDVDLEGFVRPERLAQMNDSLAKHPYEGLVVACPYTPVVADRSEKGAVPFGRFVTDVLLPRVRAEAKASSDRAATGIDGVSMGGRLALFVGFAHPEIFGAVGALQPALKPEEAPVFAKLARAAWDRQPFALRLVSSDDDPFLPAVRALSAALAEVKVPHQLVVTPGPHDYAWNRGPGGAEMLLWHERVLRGLSAP
ncbi:alpha/beta hydrolase-fold protein [Polyangium sp. 15x6]|uniref:alpha/beta hydrolase n=1 Tax=Polyangium sp. 15x6 TaxID=3042687 RepID=UPI00249AF259|nr:alpha/beta hydrolase-fold protein [Polyangium sp. 15x6]MDI3287080.1 alpha/beta hydrolase-fold protein [Polyangium sp. 15x6]